MQDYEKWSYQLIRKNVKNINLRVKSDGSVVVSADPRVPKAYIDEFVQSKKDFIQKARAKILQNQNCKQQQQFRTGELIPYLGSTLRLVADQADSGYIPGWLEEMQNGVIAHFSRNNYGEAVFQRGQSLCLYSTDPFDPEHNQQLYDCWQKIQAGILCRQLSRRYYPEFEKLGVVFPEIKIRKMSSRWGSCIPGKQKVTFNSLLLEKPLESIEYVVVHEFSHFIHPDHSRAFYEFVGHILPDWKIRKTALR